MSMPEVPSPALYLLDSMSLVFQSFYAVRGLTNAKGMPTNAVFGVIRKIQKLISTQRPTHLLAVFDSPGPNFRHAIYEAYKANRAEQPEEFHVQIPWIFKVLEAMRVPYVFKEGFEADDLIGTLARKVSERGMPVVIVSADKDLFQLVGPGVLMLRSGKEELEAFGPEQVREKMGVPPERIVDFLALTGDASDNIPGVPKIGPKTAEALLKQFGSLDNLLANLDQVSSKSQQTQLRENVDKALLSRQLATIECAVDLDVDLESLECRPAMESPELLELYRELGFQSLVKEARARLAARGEAVPAAEFSAEAPDMLEAAGQAPAKEPRGKTSPAARRSEIVQEDMFGLSLGGGLAGAPVAGPAHTRVTVVRDAAALRVAVDALRKTGRFAFDTETTAIDPMRAELVGISLSVEKGAAWYIPVGHRLEVDAKRQLPLGEIQAALNPVFSGPRIVRVAHNAKYDLRILRRHGFTVAPVEFDTMLASYLLNPGGRHGLKSLAFQLLGVEMTEIDALIGRGRSAITMDRVEVERAAPYAGADADMTLRLADLFAPRLEAEGLMPLFREVEMPLVEVLDAMELEGVRVDTALLRMQEKDYAARLEDIARKIYAKAGLEFNIKSPKQVSEVLFDRLEFKPPRKGGKADSTSSEVLESLAESGSEHAPVPRLILDYRHLDKLLSTYVQTLPALVHPETGRIHTSYNQFIAATGRLSSSDPNLQNIPVRSREGLDIRRAFVPNGAGELMMAADYSQIELRILAHMTGDEALRQAFREGLDIHARTAARIFGVAPEAVTGEMRAQAKTINFGVLYGMGPHRLSQQLGLTHARAAAFIEDYFRAFPRVREWIERTLTEARRAGYVTTLSGRRRPTPDLNSPNHAVRSNAERMAVNTPVQGTAADLIKIAMIALHRLETARKWKARMVLQVHDELVYTLPAEAAADFEQVVRREMEGAMALEVPLKVDVKTGRNWAEC